MELGLVKGLSLSQRMMPSLMFTNWNAYAFDRKKAHEEHHQWPDLTLSPFQGGADSLLKSATMCVRERERG